MREARSLLVLVHMVEMTVRYVFVSKIIVTLGNLAGHCRGEAREDGEVCDRTHQVVCWLSDDGSCQQAPFVLATEIFITSRPSQLRGCRQCPSVVNRSLPSDFEMLPRVGSAREICLAVILTSAALVSAVSSQKSLQPLRKASYAPGQAISITCLNRTM